MAALLATTFTLSGCPGPVTGGAVETGGLERRPPPLIDLSAEDMTPAEELDALLAGRASSGKRARSVRVAVAPFSVLGESEQHSWVGEAAAELVSSKLVESDRVSVLERGEMARLVDELERAQQEDERLAVAKEVGTLLGAEYLVLGKLIPANEDAYRGLVTPVRVQDGVRKISARFDVDVAKNDLAAKVPRAAEDLAKTMGLGRIEAGQRVGTLTPEARRKAAMARTKHYRGELSQAQPLYAEALGELSAAWVYEADYIGLMADLGMYEWAIDRADRVLAELPEQSTTVCVRARLLGRTAVAAYYLDTVEHREQAVTNARDAIRFAVACSDDNVLASALVTYGRVIGDVSAEAARLAFARAKAVLEEGTASAWTRCEAEFYAYFFDADRDCRADGGRHERYEQIAGLCGEAGHARLQAVALHNAAGTAPGPREQLRLRRQALERARRVGGITLDIRLRGTADSLRDVGKPSEADALLVEGIGRHLRALQALLGSLRQPEAGLDDELLRRAGIERREASTRSAEDRKLLVTAHRRALADMLDAWADVTDNSSKRQADFYRGVAEELAPHPDGKSLLGKEGRARAEIELARAGVPLETLEAEGAAPRRDSGADLYGAFWSLSRWFFATPDESDERQHIADRAERVAKWHGGHRPLMWAARLQTSVHGDADRIEQGLAAVRIGRQYAHDHRWANRVIANREIALLHKRDAKAALARRRQYVDVARAQSLRQWVKALYRLGFHAVGRDRGLVREAYQGLHAARDELIEAEEWELAGYAEKRIGDLSNVAAHATGSPTAVRAYMRRWKLLENTDDPLRAATALKDVIVELVDLARHRYRGGARRQIEKDPQVSRLVGLVWAQIRALASNGRGREAARVAAFVTPWAQGMEERFTEALTWTDAFEDSVEWPELRADLLVSRAIAVDEGEQWREDREKARDLFLRADMKDKAQDQVTAFMAREGDLDEHLALYDECLDMADDDTRDDCVSAVYSAFMNSRLRAEGASPELQGKLAEVAELGKAELRRVDRTYSRKGAMTFRTGVAIIALWAERRAMATPLIEEVKHYYREVASEPYMLATELSRLGRAALEHYPELAVEVYRDFLDAGGASDFYVAQVMDEAAEAAHRAGDSAAERAFLERGRKSSRRSRYRAAYRFDLHPARFAVERDDWSTVADAYEGAVATLTRDYPRYEPRLDQLRLARVATLSRSGARQRAFEEILPRAEQIEQGLASGATDKPCHDVMLLRVASDLAMAAGRCQQGEELRGAAEQWVGRCSGSNDIQGPGVTWTDGPGFLDKWKGDHACRAPIGDVGPLLIGLD